ncbi:MAG: Gfo/Idh/MocA family protein [Crocinitomicaceae bacterium]|jgi:predicted dehydrogenase
MLKIGVIGVGHLGKIHVRLLKELNTHFELVGFYDSNEQTAKQISEEFGISYFGSSKDLINSVDCVDVVTPTLSHYEHVSEAIKMRKHVFVEKPLAETMEEAKKLVALCHEADVKVQVGHVERFNPAFQAAIPYFNSPMFIETHRLAQFNPRGTDVPVVLDLMIHDLDVILSVVKSRVKKVSASGVAVVSDSHDMTNARLEFENGCVANLTASRISLKNMRKSRFFQKDAYISVDFLSKELEVVRMQDVEGEPDPFDIVLELGKENMKKKILIDKPELQEVNAIKEELKSFYDSIKNNSIPKVSIENGFEALDVAHEILKKLH